MFRNNKKETCRNFASGSCRFGDRCKFSHDIHTNQNQPPISNINPFGFGQNRFQQQQQPKTQNQFKPFENTWTRGEPAGTNVTKQPSNDQTPVSNHTCNDPESCKIIIVDDFKTERPIWKLTCYAHWRHLPCDIWGDVSYEELRAAAYDDAKKGLSLLSVMVLNLPYCRAIKNRVLHKTTYVEPKHEVGLYFITVAKANDNERSERYNGGCSKCGDALEVVERERNMLNSKVMQFENLQRNPYVISPNTTIGGAIPFPAINNSAFPAPVQKNAPPSVSSFSQLGIPTNQGSNTRQDQYVEILLLITFDGICSVVASTNSIFGQKSVPPVSTQPSGSFGSNNLTFGTQGLFGSQQHTQQQGNGNASSFNMPFSSGKNNPTSFAGSFQSSDVAVNQSPVLSVGHNPPASLGGQTYVDRSPEGVPAEMAIWLKEKWNPGEIPEEAPPDSYVY
ncbi:hypothetical protein IFM89_005953 [Coptis chinensis]|uniref:C3H1-type domain-containing protein n=1 Tax=Coptis chinensis TaxID=261450 RepID=A0A835IB97_9MAGN|nr:hypothetical protein IFM89_005953 [Coptis chinensis]